MKSLYDIVDPVGPQERTILPCDNLTVWIPSLGFLLVKGSYVISWQPDPLQVIHTTAVPFGSANPE